MLAAGGIAGVTAVAGCLGGGTPADEEQARARPSLGSSDAPVTIEVFEDFACPHCAMFNTSVASKLKTEYVDVGDVEYQHYDFPIPVAPEVSWTAPSAARSVLGQTDHETFFEYASLLFENQAQLAPETYAEFAEKLDADGDAVRTAATEDRYRDTVEADRQEGRDRGVGGTPTVFIDGENAAEAGRLGYTGLKQQIENRL